MAAAWPSTRRTPSSPSARCGTSASTPNFGGEAMVVSLGCEKLPPQPLPPAESIPIERVPGGLGHQVCLQEQDGFAAQIEAICRQAGAPRPLNARRREIVPASELVVGVQCGGSDALSASPPTRRWASRRPAGARGATIMFSGEHRGARRHRPAHRPRRHARRRRGARARWPGTTPTCSAARWTAAPTPRRATRPGAVQHRREGHGLHRQVGLAAIARARAGREAGPRTARPHLHATPASGFICGTLQMAAGMNLHVFTTGRARPMGWRPCPSSGRHPQRSPAAGTT